MPQRSDAEPVPGVLDPERRAIEALFGVDSDQVARDHVISHALAAVASLGTAEIVFFGGTALSRTHLTDLRLTALGHQGIIRVGPHDAARAVQDALRNA